MSARKLTLALLTFAASTLAACADATGVTSPSSLAPSARPSLATGDETTCRSGWNSSTGRCE